VQSSSTNRSARRFPSGSNIAEATSMYWTCSCVRVKSLIIRFASFILGPCAQSRLGWLDGNKVDPSFPVTQREWFGRASGRPWRPIPASWKIRRKVVVTLIDHDRGRVIGNDDSARILVEIRILRATETSIDDIEGLHFLSKRLPSSDTRGACETMLPNLGGLTLSCSSNWRTEGSQSWAWASAVESK